MIADRAQFLGHAAEHTIRPTHAHYLRGNRPDDGLSQRVAVRIRTGCLRRECRMGDYTDLVERYIATWNETDAERRRALVARTFTESASYIDPLMASEGQSGIDGMIAAVQQRFVRAIASAARARSTATTTACVSRGNWPRKAARSLSMGPISRRSPMAGY